MTNICYFLRMRYPEQNVTAARYEQTPFQRRRGEVRRTVGSWTGEREEEQMGGDQQAASYRFLRPIEPLTTEMLGRVRKTSGAQVCMGLFPTTVKEEGGEDASEMST